MKHKRHFIKNKTILNPKHNYGQICISFRVIMVYNFTARKLSEKKDNLKSRKKTYKSLQKIIPQPINFLNLSKIISNGYRFFSVVFQRE